MNAQRKAGPPAGQRRGRWRFPALVLAVAWVCGPTAAPTVVAASAVAEGYAREVQPLLQEYCLKCHGDSKPKGGVNLAGFTNLARVQADLKTWESVLVQLRERTMPPDNKPQPSADERDRLAEWIERMFESLDDSQLARDPGRKTIHRLSRLEYNNTVRDLFGVDTRPADRFPPDGGGGGGFDNNADTLFVPPILMERYLSAAEEIVGQAPAERVLLFTPGVFTSRRSAARKTIESFATRGYRRPAMKEEVDGLLGLYDQAVRTGDSHEAALRLALRAILVSPDFLFRIETARDATAAYLISDYELASRLSYFLWSSMPDDELFKVAAQKRLRDPGVLEAQVRRMLQDPKARTFADNFAGQWLRVKELHTSAQPDRNRFPGYTPELRDAMYAEPVEFFYSILRENRSVLELIDSDYTFLNATLAKHYGIEGVDGDPLRRVTLTDRARGGVLGMAGVLTLTSYPLRTSPVLRGKWVLEELLGTPPPPPPPLIKSLPPDDKPKDGLSMRQRLEKHREDPNCASCHKRMDPLGFGLENFDAIGRWRTEVGGQAVDASGEMTTGEKFTGPAKLKTLLLNRKVEFTRNLTQKMLAYALGRGVEIHDLPALRRITKAVEKDDYRSEALILAIVQSHPFQYRRGNQMQLSQTKE